MSALKSGKPQIVIPGFHDTPDQLHHGGRIEVMGCGRLMTPCSRFDEGMDPAVHSEVVDLVQDMLHDQTVLAEACEGWQKKFQGLGDAKGVSVSVDTLRRIVAKILLHKPGRETDGGHAKPAAES